MPPAGLRRSSFIGRAFIREHSPKTNMQGRPVSADALLLFQWAKSHMLFMKLVGAMLAATAAVALLLGYRPRGSTELVNGELLDPLSALNGVASADPEPNRFPMWAVLAVALLIELQAFFATALIPLKHIGIMYHTSLKMVSHDIAIFVALFFVFFCTYGFSMYVCYPRAGTHKMAYAPNFNSPIGAVHELVELALTGEPIKISLLEGSPVTGGGWVEMMRYATLGEPMSADLEVTSAESFELMLFVFLYFTYVLLALVLLLNLLIASMNNTFIKVQEASELEWRVLYARNLLRLEMLAERFFTTNGGELDGGRWYFFTKAYETIEDGVDDMQNLTTNATDTFFGESGGVEQKAITMALAMYAASSSDDAGRKSELKGDPKDAAMHIQRLYRRRRQQRQEDEERDEFVRSPSRHRPSTPTLQLGKSMPLPQRVASDRPNGAGGLGSWFASPAAALATAMESNGEHLSA